MFKKNDPLVQSVQKVMQENTVRREVETKLCEELGIYSKRELPIEHHKNYDALLEQRIAEALHPNQQKLDVHEPEKDELTAQDFKLLRAKKKQVDEAAGYKYKGPGFKSEKTPPIGKEGSKRNRHINAIRELLAQIDPKNPISDEHRAKILKKISHLEEESKSSSDPDMEAPRHPSQGGKKYDDEIKPQGKEKEPEMENMPEKTPVPPKRPAGLEEARGKRVADDVLAKLRLKKKMNEEEDDKPKFADGAKVTPLLKTDKEKSDYEALHKASMDSLAKAFPIKGASDDSAKDEPAKPVKVAQAATGTTSDAPKPEFKTTNPSGTKRLSADSVSDYEKETANRQRLNRASIEAQKGELASQKEYDAIMQQRKDYSKEREEKGIVPKKYRFESAEINEKKLTDAEMAKREEIVKSMKKGAKGFKARYGERAKEVMYATATKQAKKLAEEKVNIDAVMEEIKKNLGEKYHKIMEDEFASAIANTPQAAQSVPTTAKKPEEKKPQPAPINQGAEARANIGDNSLGGGDTTEPATAEKPDAEIKPANRPAAPATPEVRPLQATAPRNVEGNRSIRAGLNAAMGTTPRTGPNAGVVPTNIEKEKTMAPDKAAGTSFEPKAIAAQAQKAPVKPTDQEPGYSGEAGKTLQTATKPKPAEAPRATGFGISGPQSSAGPVAKATGFASDKPAAPAPRPAAPRPAAPAPAAPPKSAQMFQSSRETGQTQGGESAASFFAAEKQRQREASAAPALAARPAAPMARTRLRESFEQFCKGFLGETKK